MIIVLIWHSWKPILQVMYNKSLTKRQPQVIRWTLLIAQSLSARQPLVTSQPLVTGTPTKCHLTKRHLTKRHPTKRHQPQNLTNKVTSNKTLPDIIAVSTMSNKTSPDIIAVSTMRNTPVHSWQISLFIFCGFNLIQSASHLHDGIISAYSRWRWGKICP